MKQEDFTALGISEELAKKAAEASKKELEGFIPKSRFDEVNEAKKTLEEDVKAREKQLEELKKSNGDNETLQGQIKKLQDSNKAEKERYESELKSLKIANAVKLAVNGKVHDEDLVAGLIDKEKLVIDENGGIIGLEEQVKSLQEKKAFLFKSEDTGSYKPQNGGKPSNNPFAKETFNLTEQGKLLRENPAQAKEMAAAAGVMI